MNSLRQWVAASGQAVRSLVVASMLVFGVGLGSPALWAQGDAVQDSPVNVNTADAETLGRVLVGVGPQRAQAIVDYREANGAFADIADLANVKGIGMSTVARNQERIVAE